MSETDHPGSPSREETSPRQRNENQRALVEAMFRQALEGRPLDSPPTEPPPGIHYTQLQEDTSNALLAREWNVYCRAVGRLLSEGHESQFVLIEGEEILGFFESWGAAREVGLKRFGREPFFVHEIRTVEPHLRLRGINLPWLNCTSPSVRQV
jgi:hypothetical protein